jgi:hypothetical protein
MYLFLRHWCFVEGEGSRVSIHVRLEGRQCAYPWNPCMGHSAAWDIQWLCVSSSIHLG